MIEHMGITEDIGGVIPTQSELDGSVARFQADWGLVDEVLYDLCAKHPGHSDRRVVTAKFALVGRAYAAGLERRVSPPPGKQAIDVISDYALKHGSQIDQIIHGLDGIHEPLDARAMGTIVEQHGRLTELLQVVATDGKAPRSFASKYLHFHRPFVPIYDDYARQKLGRKVGWERSYVPFELPASGDRLYWDFCLRFFRIYQACGLAGLRVTVKTLDALLWAVPNSGASENRTSAV
jgi:hypothetical protein